MFRRTLVASAALLAVTLAGAAAQAQVRIATVGPMTGSNASFGAQMKAGAEQAVADLNKAGGVNGQQIVLEIGDDACDPKQAVSVANQMASRKVVFVAGHFCSSSSIPANKVYAQRKAYCRSARPAPIPRLTDEGGWNIFRVCGRDDQQGTVAGRLLGRKSSSPTRLPSCMTTRLMAKAWPTKQRSR